MSERTAATRPVTFDPTSLLEVNRRFFEVSFDINRRAAEQWRRLAEKQLAFVQSMMETTLEELRGLGESDPRRIDLARQIEVWRRLGDSVMTHVRETGELVLEGQREMAERMMAAFGAAGEAVAGQPAAEAETPVKEEPAEGEARRPGTRRSTTAA